MKSSNFEPLLDRTLRKVFMNTLKEIPSKIPVLYTSVDSDKAIEYDYELGDIGSIGQFTGKIDYQDVYGQYKTSYEHNEFAGGLQIQRKLIDDDNYSVIQKAPNLLALGMRRRRETDAASVFNNAFNAAYKYGDTLSLCNSAHTAEGNSTTWSNTGTTALTPASLSATRILMMKYTSSSNQLVEIEPDAILVPVDLGDTASEIIKSNLKPDTANNNINVNSDRFKIVEWKYLTDTNNWFMLDSRLMKMQLMWFNRIPIEFNKDVDSDTYIRKFSSYMRYSNGASGWRFVYGHDV